MNEVVSEHGWAISQRQYGEELCSVLMKHVFKYINVVLLLRGR